MGATERRKEIIRALCRRKHDTISNLASEFGVSKRTISRDVEVLSLSEPIYTQSGRYNGGVYILNSYYPDKSYLSPFELDVLKKVLSFADKSNTFILEKEETEAIKSIINQFTKPSLKKEH